MAAISATSAAASVSLGMRLGLNPLFEKLITALASSGTVASNGKRWVGKVVPFDAYFDSETSLRECVPRQKFIVLEISFV